MDADGNSAWENLSLAVRVAAGVHRVTLEFTNDLWRSEAGEDRNLWIRQLSITP